MSQAAPASTAPTTVVRRADGSETGTVELDPAVFAREPNVALLHQVVTGQLAAARAGTQSTRTPAEVRGGGAKPWRQKGTGRARHGSSRAPQWTGGGLAHAPKPRSYRVRTPKKMVQLALRSALSDRAATDRVVVVDAWPFTTPRTRDAREALSALGIDGRVLVVVSTDDEVAYKSFRNLPHVHVVIPEELNAYDVLCSDWVVFTRATLPTSSAPEDQGGAGEPSPAPTAEEAPS